jgi:uncharacterized protein HemY
MVILMVVVVVVVGLRWIVIRIIKMPPTRGKGRSKVCYKLQQSIAYTD